MSYAGDVLPEQAFAALQQDRSTVLVDVRTGAEWTYVGLPEVSSLGKAVVLVEWQRFPDGSVNDRFVDELREAGITAGTPVYFLCRSGVRSVAAAEAATAAGLGPAYNIVHGFEGPLDRHGRRTVAGWKISGLPWRQG
jgi:rhodanese-related sulfurtransferase